MKRVIISLCLLAVVHTYVVGQETAKQVGQPDTKLAQELMALDQTWREARQRGDTDTMSRLMAAEWGGVNSDGFILTKERALAGAKAGNWKDRPLPVKDNVTARTYGNTAILTYRTKTETGYVQALQVWVKRQGRWQWVVANSTKLAEQQPQ